MSSKSSPSSAPRLPARDSSSSAPSGVRPKSLGLHGYSIPTQAEPSTARALDSLGNGSDSCQKIATTLLRRSRNELAITQDRVAALADKHTTIVGRRERGEVDLGPLRDWVLLLREMIRTKGPEAASTFMAEFISVLASKDSKK